MRYENLIIEVRELEKLKRIISAVPQRVDASYYASINKFRQELQTAKTVTANEMPYNVIRFDSIVTVRDSSGTLFKYQIVSPEQSNVSNGKISIIAPMELALFGYAENDEVKWQFPGGMQVLKIIKVEQGGMPQKTSKNETFHLTSKP